MAVVEMSKLRLMGLKSERETIVNVLTRSHRFELLTATDFEGTVREKETSHLERITAKQVKAAFAIRYLYGANDEMQKLLLKNRQAVKAGVVQPLDYEYTPLPKPSSNREIVGYDDLYDSSAKEY